MKQVNFNHEGGFPLEQETLERLQTAYRSELYEALKRHLSIDLENDYILAHATDVQKGWAVIRQEDPANPGNQVGILYPITIGTQTDYLKTTRTDVNLIYGTSASQTAYYDYEAEYSLQKYNDEVVVTKSGDVQTIKYYNVSDLVPVTDIKTIDEILKAINSSIDAIQANINVIEGNINAIETNIDVIEGDVNTIKGDINTIKGNINAIETNIDVIEGDVTQIDGYLAKALVDTSIPGTTNLTLNYQSNWTNTHVGGKIYLDNTNTSTEDFILAKTSPHSLLLTDNVNQVFKSNNLLDSLLKRITKLETQPASSIPIGMIAIWGKTDPIPSGWEEYVPLRGRVPVGLNIPETEFNAIDKTGGTKSYGLSAPVPLSGYNYSENTSNGTSGKLVISTGKQELGENLESIAIVSASPYINFTVNNLSPYRVVQFIVYTGIQTDLARPTNLIVTNIDFTSLRLTWTAPIDSTGLSNYVLYKNGSEFVTLGNTVTSHPVSGLTKGTYYTFSVVAKNTAGTLSAASTVSATTKNVDPTMPTNLNGESRGENSIYISWGAPADVGVINYEIYRRQTGMTSVLHKTVLGNVTSYIDSGSYSTTYIYKVRAIYSSGAGPFTESEVEVTTDPIDIQCFDVESLVTMASGQSKKLKNIVIGDKLQGLTFPNEIDESDGDYMIWNGKLNEAAKAEVTVVNKITSVQPNYYEIQTADKTLKVTGQHPLLVSEDGENVKWVCVKNILPTMLLIDKTGKTKAIESILFVEEPLEVALLDVETVDNYVISGIVAHNNKPLDPHDPQP